MDDVSASSLAEAAARGVIDTKMPSTSKPRVPCALPTAEFEIVCIEIDKVANPARAAWLASKKMVSSLRNRRSLLLPSKFEWVVESRPRVRSGLGLELSLTDDGAACTAVSDSCRLVIVAVHPGSPADEAGLMIDDFVIGLNGPLTAGLSCQNAVMLDHFNVGTDVRVEVDRKGVNLVKTLRAVSLTVPPVRSRVVDGRIGYLHLNTFSKDVHEQTRTALNELLDIGIDRLVLDLRGNGGGSLNASAGVAGLFLPDESVVVIMTHQSTQTRYTLPGWETAPDPAMPLLAVAVDGGSASASELVTGALVDHGRATAVGSTTYGKGTAQIYNLLRDSTGKVRGVLILTTGRWTTPLGRSPVGGLAPDVHLDLPPCMHPDEVSRRASAAIRPYIAGIGITSSPSDGHSYKPGEAVTLAVLLTAPVSVDTTAGAPTMSLSVTGRARRASYRPDAPDSSPTTLIFEYTITAEDAENARVAGADIGVCGVADTHTTHTGGVTTDEIGVGANSVDAGVATIRSAAGLDAVLAHSVPELVPPTDQTPRFTDITHCDHREAIESIAEAGITSGCNPPDNDRFCPNRPVTRAETASFLARAATLPEASDDYFTDDNGSTHEDSINRLALAGITSGCAHTDDIRRFCPQLSVSRAQTAALLTRAFNPQPLPPPHEHSRFTDTAHSLHREAIDLLTAAGIGFACNPPDNDRFCPNQPVTRAEMAELIVQTLSRTAER